MIRFYFKNGRWRVTADKRAVNARDWWNAINHVKCMNHKLRTAAAGVSLHQRGHVSSLRSTNQGEK